MIAQSRQRAQSSLRNFADALTIGRAVAGLPLMLALQVGWLSLAWLLLLLAALSDVVDGWLARRAGGGSSWGARLDPLADKLLLAAPIIWLASTNVLPLWSIWLLLARELLVSGWRAQASSGGPASWGGQSKNDPAIPQRAALAMATKLGKYQPVPSTAANGLVAVLAIADPGP